MITDPSSASAFSPASRIRLLSVCLAVASVLLMLFVPAVAAEKPPKPNTRNTNPSTTDVQYQLGPADVVQVFVWKEPDLSATVVVRPDGNISLPITGELQVSGKTALDVEKDVSDRLRHFVTNPVVSVIVKEVNSPHVTVLGQVKKPDSYKLTSRITVIEAIALAGGFTDFAKRDKITVLRNTPGGQQSMKVKFKELIAGTAFYLQPSDTVYVE